MKSVTIGFIPRERFSSAPESLRSIIEETRTPHELIIVNCDIPPKIWQQIEEIIDGRENIRILHSDHFLLPNQARNRVIRETTTEYLCLIENDNLVEAGWLSKLITACEEQPADVAIPLLMEGRPGTTKVHFDDNLGSVATVSTPEGQMFEVVPRTPTRKLLSAGRQDQEFMETHCLLFKTSVFERIGELDETINTSEEVDLSLALWKAQVRSVFEPGCRVHYVLPTFPLSEEDKPYFMMKWDVKHARRSHAHLQRKWKLSIFPQIMGFVTERFYRGSNRLEEWAAELRSVNSSRGRAIIVGLEEFGDPQIFDSLDALPFVEKDGHFWGAPENDEVAIAEIERLRQDKGASLLVFLWEHYWQLEHYKKFAEYLRDNYDCVIDTEYMIAFDLSIPRSQQKKAV